MKSIFDFSSIKTEEPKCDFCQSLKKEKVVSAKDYYNNCPGVFSAVRCLSCSLVFTSPRPIKDEMKFFYPDSSGYFSPCQFSPKKNNFYQKIKKILYREYYHYFPDEQRSFLLKIILFPLFLLFNRSLKIIGFPDFVSGGKILDIGCSWGGFLQEMKILGWEVFGVEPNQKAAQWGRENLRLNVFTGNIDDFYTEEKFDVITMRMCLEHLYSPKEILKKVKSWLKPNGQLIIIVPDFNGWEMKLFGQFAYGLQLPTHLYHFMPNTIKKYLQNFSTKKIKIYHHDTDRDFLMPFYYLKKEGKKIGFLFYFFTFFIVRKTFVKIFIKILSLIGKTSRMTIYVKL